VSEHTSIEWADHTFNPRAGGTKVSPACDGGCAEIGKSRRLVLRLSLVLEHLCWAERGSDLFARSPEIRRVTVS
jgi:Protein of unknown function (DUF5131)